MAVCGSGIGRVVTIPSNPKQLYNLICILDCFYMLRLMLVSSTIYTRLTSILIVVICFHLSLLQVHWIVKLVFML
jgi:hypothetical protein